MSDIDEILAGCVRSNGACQKQLYERYYGYALKTVFRYIFSYEAAVDAVNDGFIKVFRSIPRFATGDVDNTERVLMGWMRRIMINTAIDSLRKNQMKPETDHLPGDVWEETSQSDNADQLLLYKNLVEQVRKLPPVYRAVFNMHVIDGLSHNEIAEILGIAVGTSKSNLSKARVLLQSYLAGQDKEEEYAGYK